MNIQKTKDGFTLIEIIVAINVAFIAFTLIISLCIILNKVFISGTKKIEEKALIHFSFNILKEMLRKEEYYTFISKKDTMEIKFSSTARVVFTKDMINIKDFIFIKNFSEYSIKVENFDNTENYLNNSNINFNNNKTAIPSKEIKSTEITLVKNKIIYKSVFITPLISCKRFKNI